MEGAHVLLPMASRKIRQRGRRRVRSGSIWRDTAGTAFGEQIEVSQGAEVGRPSTLYVRVEGSTERIEQVRVGGYAVLVGRGEFDLPD